MKADAGSVEELKGTYLTKRWMGGFDQCGDLYSFEQSGFLGEEEVKDDEQRAAD